MTSAATFDRALDEVGRELALGPTLPDPGTGRALSPIATSGSSSSRGTRAIVARPDSFGMGLSSALAVSERDLPRKHFISLWQVAYNSSQNVQWAPLKHFAQNNLQLWHAEQNKSRNAVRGMREKHFKGVAPFGALGVLHDHTSTMLHKFIAQINAQFVNRKGDLWEVPIRFRTGEENLDVTVRRQRAELWRNPALEAALRRLWASLPKDHRGGLTQEVHRIVFTAVFDVFAFDLWDARERFKLVQRDWECRAEGRPAIDDTIFLTSMKVVCDAWCETTDPLETIEFVETLTTITSEAVALHRDEIQRATATHEFHAAEEKAESRNFILGSLGRRDVSVGAGGEVRAETANKAENYSTKSLVSFVAALSKGDIPHFSTRKVKTSARPEQLPPTIPARLLEPPGPAQSNTHKAGATHAFAVAESHSDFASFGAQQTFHDFDSSGSDEERGPGEHHQEAAALTSWNDASLMGSVGPSAQLGRQFRKSAAGVTDEDRGDLPSPQKKKSFSTVVRKVSSIRRLTTIHDSKMQRKGADNHGDELGSSHPSGVASQLSFSGVMHGARRSTLAATTGGDGLPPAAASRNTGTDGDDLVEDVVQDFTFEPAPKIDSLRKYRDLVKIASAMQLHPPSDPEVGEPWPANDGLATSPLLPLLPVETTRMPMLQSKVDSAAAALLALSSGSLAKGAEPRPLSAAEIDFQMQRFSPLDTIKAPKKMMGAFKNWRGSMHCSSNNMFPTFSPRCTGTETRIDVKALRSFAMPSVRLPLSWFVLADERDLQSWVSLGPVLSAALTSIWYDGVVDPVPLRFPPQFDADHDVGTPTEPMSQLSALRTDSGLSANGFNVYMNEVAVCLLADVGDSRPASSSHHSIGTRNPSSSQPATPRHAVRAPRENRRQLCARFDYLWEYQNSTKTSWLPFPLDVQNRLTAALRKLGPPGEAASGSESARSARSDGRQASRPGTSHCSPLTGRSTSADSDARPLSTASRGRMASGRSRASRQASAMSQRRSASSASTGRRAGIVKLRGAMQGLKGADHDVDLRDGVVVSWVRSKDFVHAVRCATIFIDEERSLRPERVPVPEHVHLYHHVRLGEDPSVREVEPLVVMPTMPAVLHALQRLPFHLRLEAGIVATKERRDAMSVLKTHVTDVPDDGGPHGIFETACDTATSGGAAIAAAARRGTLPPPSSSSQGHRRRTAASPMGDPDIEGGLDNHASGEPKGAPLSPARAALDAAANSQAHALVVCDSRAVSTRYVVSVPQRERPPQLSKTKIDMLARRGAAIVNDTSGVPRIPQIHESPIRGKHIDSRKYGRTGGGLASRPHPRLQQPEAMAEAAKRTFLQVVHTEQTLRLEDTLPPAAMEHRAQTPSAYCKRVLELSTLTGASDVPDISRPGTSLGMQRPTTTTAGSLKVAQRVAVSRAITPELQSVNNVHRGGDKRFRGAALPSHHSRPPMLREALTLSSIVGGRVSTPSENIRLLQIPSAEEIRVQM